MDPRYSGFGLDPAKCRLLSIDEKREIVRELSKWPERAPEKLQTWSRRDILEILCAELGRERKYTGLSKQRMLEYLFRVVTDKPSGLPGERLEDRDSTPEPNTPNLQSPSKRQRKNDHPSRLPVVVSNPVTTDVTGPPNNTRCCQNSACRATLNLEDKFCRRCSCCICSKYDDNKDPSLWLFCSSDQPLQKDSCGLSCHIECALNNERSGILRSGRYDQPDGDYYCTYCGRRNDLLGCWKKQLLIAKDARRLDVLCHRIFLSHKLLCSTKKYVVLHEIVDTALKKLEAEVGPITGIPNMGRGIVNRLSVGAEVQQLCVRAIETLQLMLSGALLEDSQIQRAGLIPPKFIKVEDLSQTSLTVVLDLNEYLTVSREVSCFNVWHRKAGMGAYPSNPTGIILAPLKTLVVSELAPATDYIFKVVAFSNSKEFGSWEINIKTEASSKDDPKISMPGNAAMQPNNGSPKTNSGGLSNPSSEGVESNNNTTVYTDLNKSPESDFEYCENPEILDSDKASHNPNEPAGNSQNSQRGMISGAEGTELEDAPGLSASALDEEPNSTVQIGLHRESSHLTDHNIGAEVPRSENASNAPIGNELVIVPHRCSGSTLPITPRGMENGKESSGRSFKAKPADHILQNGPSKPEREPGSSSNKRTLGKFEDIGHKDGCPEASYEYCVKVVRWLECEGFIETNFRVKFLTWFSLRATLHQRRIVSVYVDTLIDDPVSLAGQLADTFSEAIYSKRPPPVPTGFCMELWH